MNAISYESLSSIIRNFAALGTAARAMDSIETFMVVQRATALNLPAAALYQAWARQDAQRAWAREQAAAARLQGCHEWFAQSRQSLTQLARGSETWARAHNLSQQASDAMRQVINQPTQWEGAGADEQRKKAGEQLHAQEELTQVTNNLQAGCTATATVMKGIFMQVALTLHGNAHSAMGSATRAPSPATSFFSLNTRVKAVAKAMEQAASDYEAVRAGRGWRQQSEQLADTFTENGARLAHLSVALKMTMRPLAV